MDNQPPVIVSSQEPKSTRKGLILVWTSATTFSKLVGVMLLVLAVFSFAQTLYFSEQQRLDVVCQSEFVEHIGSALDVRGAASEANNLAIDSLLYSVRDAVGTEDSQDQLNRAFAKYEATREIVIKAKMDNPYPSLTLSEMCVR